MDDPIDSRPGESGVRVTLSRNVQILTKRITMRPGHFYLPFLLALGTGLSISSAYGKVTHLFNNAAAGAKLPTVVRINGMPCAQSSSHSHLFCMPWVMGTSRESREMITTLTRDLAGELKTWSAEGLVYLYPNLAGVVFDRYMEKGSKPEFLVERGTGYPVPEGQVGYYLRIPVDYDLVRLRKWANEEGELLWGKPLVTKLLEMKRSKLLAPFCCDDSLEQIRRKVFRDGALDIRTYREGDPRYHEYLVEKEQRELQINPDKRMHQEKVLKDCQEKSAAPSEAGMVKWEHMFPCLKDGRFTGAAELKFNNEAGVRTVCETEWVLGKLEGQLECQGGGTRTLTSMKGGVQHGPARYYARNERGIEFLVEEKYYENDSAVGRIARYRDENVLKEEEFISSDGKSRKLTAYCPNGKDIKVLYEGRIGENGEWEQLRDETFVCPGP